MRRYGTILLAVMAVSAWAQPEDPQLRAEITKVYRKWERLAARGNDEAMFAMLAPEWVMIDQNGRTMNKGDLRGMIQEFKRTMRNYRTRIKVVKVEGNGDEAVAWVETTDSFDMKRGRRWVRTSFTGRYAETFKRTSNGWMFTISQALPTEVPWPWKTN